jgi:hypothetical protein
MNVVHAPNIGDRLIAGLDSGAPAAKPATTTPHPGGDPAAAKAQLTPDVIKRIYDESPTAMQEILRFLADNPGQEFSTRDLGQALSTTTSSQPRSPVRSGPSDGE